MVLLGGKAELSGTPDDTAKTLCGQSPRGAMHDIEHKPSPTLGVPSSLARSLPQTSATSAMIRACTYQTPQRSFVVPHKESQGFHQTDCYSLWRRHLARCPGACCPPNLRASLSEQLPQGFFF